jgi:hypothetical protein
VDALERSFWNGVLGSQHPSGRWWTYNTPMNGVREASAHTIVFQSRAGTPELNCCSVNAPRGLGMVSEWGVMRRGRDIALHYLGPMSASVPLEDGSSLDILTTTSYPFNGKVDLLFQNHSSQEVTVHVHRPGWAPSPRMTGPWQESSAHDDVTLRCPAKGKVQASLDFDMPLHYRIGDMEQIQRVAIYRGPILLAYDQTLNLFDDRKIPVIDLRRLAEARVVTGDRPTSHPWRPAPWLVVDLPALDGSVRVADFASVGAVGTTYRSWLPASPIPPPLPVLLEPTGQAPLPPGPLVLLWRRPGGDASLRYHVRVRPAENPSAAPVVDVADLVGPRVVLSADQTRGMEPGKAYRLELATTNDSGQERLAPSVPIEIDASLPPLSPDQWTEFGERADGCLIEASLATPGPPGFGLLDAEEGLSFTSPDDPFAGSVHIAGGKSRLIYRLRRFPDDYTLGVWVKLHQMPVGLGQIASAWCQGGDDPLRLCLDRGQLHARVEGMGGASTTGVPIDLHTWHHLAIRKEGAVLCLFVDGTESARTHAPKRLMSRSQAIALGRNPRYGGDESIDASFARLRFDVRPLSDDELKKMARATSNDPR